MTSEIEERIKQAAAALLSVGAREVYLFGSVAGGSADPESDVDLAVAGLPPSLFFRAMGMARRALQRPLDLVDLDEPTPSTDYLRKSGELKRVG